jgi:hypothetical protein
MANVDLKSSVAFSYSSTTVERARRSLACSPFHPHLLLAMRDRSVPINEIAGQSGVQQGYTKRPISELAAENDLLWLIQVGVLRREVDGQGITDSFRLTPLGRQLVEHYQGTENVWETPSRLDRFYNALSRWLRLPF